MRLDSTENLVKVTIPLPSDNLAGADSESVWAEAQDDGTYRLKNVPFYAKGMSREDVVEAETLQGALVYRRVVRRGGHSTYRIYASSGRTAPDVVALVETLERMHCNIEPATDKLVGVDVLPEADVYKVYAILQEAEREGIVDFQEGHCGHPLKGRVAHR
jgi:hypothetical protein